MYSSDGNAGYPPFGTNPASYPAIPPSAPPAWRGYDSYPTSNAYAPPMEGVPGMGVVERRSTYPQDPAEYNLRTASANPTPLSPLAPQAPQAPSALPPNVLSGGMEYGTSPLGPYGTSMAAPPLPRLYPDGASTPSTAVPSNEASPLSTASTGGFSPTAGTYAAPPPVNAAAGSVSLPGSSIGGAPPYY